MSHPVSLPKEFKDHLSDFVNNALQKVEFSKYGNEPNYTPALIQYLNGLEYEDDSYKVTFEGAVMTSVSRGSAERWSGADCAVITTISEIDKRDVRKATLIQSKIGQIENLPTAERERLVEQIRDMQALTKNPKVLEISKRNGAIPIIVSANGILNGRRLQHQSFGKWVSTRVLPTFDGDTRPSFVDAVLDAHLSKLKIYAREKDNKR